MNQIRAGLEWWEHGHPQRFLTSPCLIQYRDCSFRVRLRLWSKKRYPARSITDRIPAVRADGHIHPGLSTEIDASVGMGAGVEVGAGVMVGAGVGVNVGNGVDVGTGDGVRVVVGVGLALGVDVTEGSSVAVGRRVALGVSVATGITSNDSSWPGCWGR